MKYSHPPKLSCFGWRRLQSMTPIFSSPVLLKKKLVCVLSIAGCTSASATSTSALWSLISQTCGAYAKLGIAVVFFATSNCIWRYKNEAIFNSSNPSIPATTRLSRNQLALHLSKISKPFTGYTLSSILSFFGVITAM